LGPAASATVSTARDENRLLRSAPNRSELQGGRIADWAFATMLGALYRGQLLCVLPWLSSTKNTKATETHGAGPKISLDIAIIASRHHAKNEGGASRILPQNKAARADQGRRGWRNRTICRRGVLAVDMVRTKKAQPQKSEASGPKARSSLEPEGDSTMSDDEESTH